MGQAGDARDTAIANPTYAQGFDTVFGNDLGGVSIKDNATVVLNKNLDLPDYFRLHANADGSLTVDIGGLKTVYGDQAQALTQASTQTLNLAQFVDQAQRQSLLSNASLNTILQSVPADVKQQVQAQYLTNQKTIATANAVSAWHRTSRASSTKRRHNKSAFLAVLLCSSRLRLTSSRTMRR